AQLRLRLRRRNSHQRFGECVAEDHVRIGLELLEVGERLASLDARVEPARFELRPRVDRAFRSDDGHRRFAFRDAVLLAPLLDLARPIGAAAPPPPPPAPTTPPP